MWYTLCCIFAPEIKKSRTKNDNAMEGLFIFFLVAKGLFILFMVATSVGSLLNDYVNEAKKVKGER